VLTRSGSRPEGSTRVLRRRVLTQDSQSPDGTDSRSGGSHLRREDGRPCGFSRPDITHRNKAAQTAGSAAALAHVTRDHARRWLPSRTPDSRWPRSPRQRVPWAVREWPGGGRAEVLADIVINAELTAIIERVRAGERLGARADGPAAHDVVNGVTACPRRSGCATCRFEPTCQRTSRRGHDAWLSRCRTWW
jgi:hypothetical protein